MVKTSNNNDRADATSKLPQGGPLARAFMLLVLHEKKESGQRASCPDPINQTRGGYL